MTRLLGITLALFVAVAPAAALDDLLIEDSRPRGERPNSAPVGPTKDEHGNPLYAGRTLAAWVADLKDADALVREEAIEVIGQAGRAARSATPELRKLLKAGDPEARLRAALAVWKVGGDAEGIAAVLAGGMKDASPAVRREALGALGAMGADAAVAARAVVDGLDDPDPATRTQADVTLRQLGRVALPALMESLRSERPAARLSALTHLVTYAVPSLGKEHVPALEARLGDDTPACRVEAARILWAMGRTGGPVLAVLREGVRTPDLRLGILQTLLASPDKPKTLLPLLWVCLDGPSLCDRVTAARVLYQVEKKPQGVLPLYLEILRGPVGQNNSDASLAITALLDLKADALPALSPLVELLKTPNYYAPYDLRTVLANIGEPAVGPLVDLLRSATLPAGSPAPEAAVDVLGRIGRPSVKAVLPLLSDRDESVRVRAIRVVAALGPHAADAVPRMIDAIDHRSPAVREAALRALGNIDRAALPAVPRLMEMAGDADPNLRLLALQTLASIRPDARGLVPLCLPLLRDPSPSMRQAALQVLVGVAPGHKAVVPAALKLLDDPATRLSALQIVRSLGAAGAKAVPRVTKLLADPDDNTRRTAAYALGEVGPAARSAAPALLDLLKSPDPYTVGAAASALMGVKPDAGSSLPRLIASLDECRDASAGPVLVLVGGYGPSAEKAFPAVLAVLEDAGRPPQVRAQAAVALSRISPTRAAKEALPSMRRVFALPGPKLLAAWAIFQADPADAGAVAFFESQLGDATPAARAAACSTLGQIGPPARRFLLRLRELCKDEVCYVRPAAAMAAFRVTKDVGEALPTLGAMLDDPTPYSKSFAASYLGEMGRGAELLLPKLRALRAAGDAYARSNAAAAILKIDRAVAAATPAVSPDPDENP